ncbi:MAG: molybdopterin molybdotransferase MoeA [Ilumatobacteraceae bacterium]
MIHPDEARAHVLSNVGPLDVVALPLAQARGLALAETVVAGEDVPPFVNSAVDGYAVRSTDVASVPVELAVVGEVAAGAFSEHELAAGESIRIMTGAPVPRGADAIVMVEDTERLDGGHRVRIGATVEAGTALRGVGDDIRAGTELFTPGTVVSAPVTGVLASVNVRTVAVTRRARVAVLSTGDELVTDGSLLRPGQIRESNLTMLLGLVADAGAESVDVGVVPDDEAALEAVLRDAAATCDAIVSSGGVSMGDYDVVKAVLSRIAEMRWMQLAIKPAKPFAFGLLDTGDAADATGGRRRVPVFGLPGNPVSSMVSFELFARPALRTMMAMPSIDRPRVTAIADADFRRRPDGKTHYQRATASFGADGRVHVAPVSAQGSHQLAATSLADAMVLLPDGDGAPVAADVDTILLW